MSLRIKFQNRLKQQHVVSEILATAKTASKYIVPILCPGSIREQGA